MERHLGTRTRPVYDSVGKYEEIYGVVPNNLYAFGRVARLMNDYYTLDDDAPSFEIQKALLFLNVRADNFSCCSGGKPVVTASDFITAVEKLGEALGLMFGVQLPSAMSALYQCVVAIVNRYPRLPVKDRVSLFTRAFNLLVIPPIGYGWSPCLAIRRRSTLSG